MGGFTWTAEQQQAIETVDRSVLVSAAAGSGKTAVLAERCAHLVCGAPAAQRCNVDELLVVTFTEAAAAEMRSRVHQALSKRSLATPEDRRLRLQVSLVDTAQISTLHAFCLWMVRRWFHRVGVDASAQLLDEDEAKLLRAETLRRFFDELYAADDDLAKRFRTLVDDYGLGQDASISTFVSNAAAFANSLPDPQNWYARARDCADSRIQQALVAHREALLDELLSQAEFADAAAKFIKAQFPVCAFYGRLLAELAATAGDWATRLAGGSETAWETVRCEIMETKLSSQGAPRFAKDAPLDVLQQRDAARDLFVEAQRLLTDKLKNRLCRFTIDELRTGVVRVAPYAATLADLCDVFQRRFDETKRRMGVMDFADLERLAFRLLTESRPGEAESAVALEMRRRFAHVLVDEFQDINPLQARLLSLVSREGAGECLGNLFAVGDVKQSIYRFRLAEPAMFLEREHAFRDPASAQACVYLQKNFRSTPAILAAVNAVFRQLMRADAGGIEYDQRAELQPADVAVDRGPSIELHMLERQVRPGESIDERRDDDTDREQNGSDDCRPDFVDVQDPAQWRGVEREAWLIGERIQLLFESGMTIASETGPRSLRFGDICVLLRSPKHSAAPLAAMLAAMGIPVWAESGGSLFETVEVRDVLALLSAIDNTRQDIPLACVLRSGILGARLNEDELTEVRALDRRVAFHEAVRMYEGHGNSAAIKEKLRTILRRIDKYREQMRVRSPADVLRMIYGETGYLAYVGGLVGGPQRRANLLALHERARQFSSFRRQGLRRFLRFIDGLKDADDQLAAPAPVAETDDVVRIMSIHKSKGLEFPVVIAAELGREFNLQDSRGQLLYDRNIGIGLRAVDRERLITYPTAMHQWCVRSLDEASRAEELRVWYVATTRAKQKLILVGTERLGTVNKWQALGRMHGSAMSRRAIMSAKSPLEWMVSALSGLPDSEVQWPNARQAGHLFEVATYDVDQIRNWSVAPTDDRSADALRRAVAAMQPLPDNEPRANDPREAVAVIDRLDEAYRWLGASSIRAAQSASEVKRLHDAILENEQDTATGAEFRPPLVIRARMDRTAALHRGSAVHAVLQFIDRSATSDADAVRGELDRLIARGAIDAEAAALIDVDTLVWFFSTDLGRRIRKAPRYLREWMFLGSEPVSALDPTSGAADDDRILIRGVVDGILVGEVGVEIVDFKTDEIDAASVEQRAAGYAMQIQLYGSAASEVFCKPVTATHLVFLHPRQIVSISGDRT